jgi:ABC-type antimicrobial peptide transport system permease subunit
VIARLKPGASIESARDDMNAVATAITLLHPQDMTGWQVSVVSLREDLVGDVETLLWTLAALLGAVLVIAATNLISLLLARARSREAAFALRVALGAGRARLARQILTEILLLGLFGGAFRARHHGGAVADAVAAAPATSARMMSRWMRPCSPMPQS